MISTIHVSPANPHFEFHSPEKDEIVEFAGGGGCEI